MTNHHHSLTVSILLLLLTLPATPVFSQQLGLFEGHTDVGAVKHAGAATYDAVRQEYHLEGSGYNMWFDHDEFHFVWKRMTGDFILRADAELLGEGVDPHRKLGWIVRTSLDSSAAYVDAAVHGDGLTALQFRRTAGAETEQVESTMTGPDVIQLARKGSTYRMSVAHHGEPLETVELSDVDLGDDVYVGLFVSSHNEDVIEKAVFRNVRIIVPAADDFTPYRDYIGSNLEVMEVATGHRKIIYRHPESLQAPNWTRDGKALIYNHSGLLYRFDLEKGTPEVLNTGFATRNNNDHVISFDGKRLGISHHSADHNGQSVVYTMPLTGGTPTQITPTGPSYFHSWSPDDKFLTYTAQREGDYDIYVIPSAGGPEQRMTTAPGLDDGPEYTPDGQYIYFNSTRTGTMQLWRMKADGSEEEQVTDDGFNNWFPHFSPDGKWIVFLSFLSDVDPTDHPFYKHVYIRLMPTEGGTPKILAYVYGGQGTINVPSWSPDGKFVAFVSNTQLPATAQSSSSAPSTSTSFFITSAGPGNGADLGGLAGADQHCQALAETAGAGDKTWRAYLSTPASDAAAAIHARDRIGAGPWYNAKGVMIAADVDDLHSENSKLGKENSLTESGAPVNGRGDSPNMHDILTGSQRDGTAFPGSDDTTCSNWTSSGEGSARVGHHDLVGGGEFPTSWNSAHGSSGCSQENLQGTGGNGLFYCFAVN